MGGISERLARFKELSKYIDHQICRLEELEAAVGPAGAASFDSFGRAAGTNADRTGRLAATISDLEADIRELTQQETEERRELDKMLRILAATERAVIQMHYFDRMTWEQLAEVMGMSTRGCQMACSRGLGKLDEAYPGDE